MTRTTTVSWVVPYCRRCNMHVYRTDQVRTHTALAFAPPTALGVWALGVGSTSIGTALLLLGAAFGITAFVKTRQWATAAQLPSCTASSAAVILEGWYGHAQNFRFSNQAFAEEVLKRNPRKSHSGLLSG